MTNEQAAPNTQANAGGRCVCEEVRQSFEKFFQVSPDVRQHLANSRIEFLRAVRSMIDQRIDHLSSKAQQHGSRIAVE
jgi:hypothetical protein